MIIAHLIALGMLLFPTAAHRSRTITFIGANIKGTPAMKAASVLHDLRRIKSEADVFGVQEFKWPWYWRTAHRLLDAKWATYPGWGKGLGHPIDGAQAIFWRRRLFKRIAVYGVPAFDFAKSSAGIMDNRYMRAVLLEVRATGERCWYASTHFVVGGDRKMDSARRREFMRENLKTLDAFLGHLTSTGFAVMMELDANIHPGTWAYGELMDILKKHGAKTHGVLGVEYLFTIDGKHTQIHCGKAETIPTSQLDTDHESRVQRHQLVS